MIHASHWLLPHLVASIATVLKRSVTMGWLSIAQIAVYFLFFFTTVTVPLLLDEMKDEGYDDEQQQGSVL
jgi:hypothetical protein